MTTEKKNTQQLTKKDNIRHVVWFFIFSNSAGIIQALSFTLCNEVLKLSYTPCYLTALTLSIIWNFTLNREITFKSATNIPIAMLKIAAFYVVFAPLSTWWGNAMTQAGINEYLVLAFTMCINLTTEFLYYRFVVFRNSINTNKRAQKQREKNEKNIEEREN
ncbi:MAG: GtrA family protein [Firmicutes bacterium]|nr:GtrA family protein [Bacillota bacterium]